MSADKPRADSAVLAAMVAAGLMIAQQVFGKATRDALFLSTFQVTALPKVHIAAAVLSLLAVLGSSRAMSLYSPARVVPVSFGASGALFLGEWWLSALSPSIAAVAVYLHLAIFGAIVTSGFWSLINERFDPHTAKRVVGRIAAAGTAGSVVGGVLAWRVASLLTVPTMLAMLAGMNAVCVWAAWRLSAPRRGDAPATERVRVVPAGPPPSGLKVLGEVPYLRQLALLVALCALAESLLDYVLKATAASSFEGGSRLVTFFALFHMGTGMVSFILQSTLSRPALDRLGLAGTVALLPGLMVLGGFVSLVFPAPWSVVLLCGIEAVLSTSLYRSGYELLYTPLAQERKRPTKTIIDVGLDRLGTTIGGGITMVVLAWAAEGAQRSLVGLTIAASLAALFVAIRLHEGYVASLAESLRSGAVKLEPDEVFDATNRKTLWETNVALTREKLLKELGLLKQSMSLRGDAMEGLGGRPAGEAGAPDLLLEAAADLRSGEAGRIRRVLRADAALDVSLVGHVLPLLARDDVLADSFHALRRVAERSTGQLLDALLDAGSSPIVRRRIPRILQGCPTQRTADGLMLGLGDAIFEVRYRCATALVRVAERNPAIAFERERVFAAARREMEVGEQKMKAGGSTSLDPEEEKESALVDETLRTRVDRHLEAVFAILSLALDREPLKIAFRALATDDDALRGTALEYLDNILPETIRLSLRPYLGGDRRAARPAPRPRQQIVEELLRSNATISLNLEALRKKAAETKAG